MGFLTKVSDGLQSLVSGLGTSRDKGASLFYTAPAWNDQQLTDAYRSAWLPRKIVNIPAFDSCRRWRSWQAAEDLIEKIEAEEGRLNLKAKMLEVLIKARLYGGAALFIGTGDANPELPLNIEAIKAGGIKYLTVMTRRQLRAGEVETDPISELYGKPKFYTISSQAKAEVNIHPSRLAVFVGSQHPDEEYNLGEGRGWGDSVLISTLDAIRQNDGTAANVASLVFEAKIDVFRIPDFMQSLADPDYESRLMRRFTLAATAKGINGALILDKDEEYEQKEASFAGLPDVMDRFMQLVSGAADIPATRLLGQSPAGMSSTGESDLRNYYDRISASQELELQPAMSILDECLIRSALGSRPPEVHYIWSSLWQISDKERADIGEKNANIIAKLHDTGLFKPEALATAATNMMIESSVMPGLQEAIDEAGGAPDFEAMLEAERDAETARLEGAKAAQEATPPNAKGKPPKAPANAAV